MSCEKFGTPMIKTADLADDSDVLFHLNKAISPDESFEDLYRDLGELRDGAIWMAQNGKDAVGFISLSYPHWNRVGIIQHFVVAEPNRGKGLGSALMKKVIDTARERQLRFLTVQTASWNKRAQNLYERFGFKHTAVFEDYLGDGNHMSWFSLKLRSCEGEGHS
jgi:ribosomal protein S18 acetylase RimI-like enzyme